MKLISYLPLAQAAARYKISVESLQRAIDAGIIRAVTIDDIVIAVAEQDVAIVVAQVQAANDGDELVSINEAARRLQLNAGVVWNWYHAGWLKEQGRIANRTLVSLQQAQALALLKEKWGAQGRRLIPKEMELSDALKLLT